MTFIIFLFLILFQFLIQHISGTEDFSYSVNIRTHSDVILIKCLKSDHVSNDDLEKKTFAFHSQETTWYFLYNNAHSSNLSTVRCNPSIFNESKENEIFLNYIWEREINPMDGAVLAYGNLNINGNCPYRSGQSTVEAFVNRDGILVPRRPTEKELFKDQLRYLFSVQSISASTAKIYPCAIYRTHFSTPNIFIEGHDYELIDDGVQHIHVITKPIESQFFKPLVKVDDMKYSDFYANEDVSITNVLYDNDKKLKMIEQSVTIDNKILVKDYGIYNISYFCDPCNKDNIPVTTYKIYFFGPQQDYELISTELHIYKHDELSFTPNCSFSSYSFGYLDMISYGDDVLYVSILNNYHVKGYKGFEVIGNEVYYIKEKNPNNILRCYYKTPTYYVVQEYNFTRIDPSKLYEKSLHNDHIFTIYEATPEDLGNISDLNEILSSASNELSLLKNHVFNMEIQTMMLTILFVFIFYAIVILLFLIYFNNKESIILWFKKKRLVRKYPNVYSWCIKLNNTEKWSTYCSVIYSKNYGSSKVLCNKKKLILKEGEEIDDRIEELYNDTLVLSQSKLKSKIYAHYIDVKLCDRCYILSDHPTSQQIPQYWEMLYKDNISVVVSFSYTPPGDDSLMWKNFWPHCDMIYDNISIFKNDSRETFIGGVNEYSYYVTCGEKSLAKNVKIYHVYRWKEHMMPEETIMLINLYKLVSASADKNAVLIDSSYGCDSGMFIYTYFACILESMLKDKTLTDPMNVIREIKECRYGGDIGAIEYGFLQKALVDFFLTGNILMDMDVYANFSTNFSAYTRSINLRVSSVPSELRTFLSFANVLDKGIVRQMCLGLHKVEEHDKDSLKELCSRWFDVENDPKLREMNRYHDIPCYDKYAIYSGEWPDYVNDPSTYLNANEISYFVTKDVERKLILCQAPTSSTVFNVVDMMFRNNVGTLVLFAKMSEHGQTWMECFPIKKSKIQFDKYTVVKVKDDEKLDVGIRMTDYYITDGNKKMYFKLYHYYDWPSKGTPINAWSFLTLYRQTIKKSEDKPILIQCPNGLGWTGCFALIIYTIDNIGKNYYFDLMNNLSIIRSHRNGAIQTEEQLMIAFTVIRDFYIKHVKDNNFDIYRWYGKYYKEFFNENGTGCMIKLIQNMKDKDSVEGFNYEFDKAL